MVNHYSWTGRVILSSIFPSFPRARHPLGPVSRKQPAPVVPVRQLCLVVIFTHTILDMFR